MNAPAPARAADQHRVILPGPGGDVTVRILVEHVIVESPRHRIEAPIGKRQARELAALFQRHVGTCTMIERGEWQAAAGPAT